MLCAVLSAFIGPLGGGYLMNVLGFEMSAFIIGCCSLVAVSYHLHCF